MPLAIVPDPISIPHLIDLFDLLPRPSAQWLNEIEQLAEQLADEVAAYEAGKQGRLF